MKLLIHRPLVTLLTRLAGALAIVVAVLPSGIYWLQVRTSAIAHVTESLRLQAMLVEDVIGGQPQQRDLAPDHLRGLLQRY